MRYSLTNFFWFTGVTISILIQILHAKSTNIFSVLKQSDSNMSAVDTNPNVTNEQVIITSNTTNYSYLLKIHFILNEAKIIPYLRDLIYYHHDIYNITTGDLIELTNFQEFTLDQTVEVLKKTNISEDKVHRVNNFQAILEMSNMTFNDFFERLKNTTKLNGQSLQTALQILSVDPGAFSQASTFGTQAEVFEVLSKGVFTAETFEAACKAVETDLPTFFKNLKSIILEQMKVNSLSHYAEYLSQYPMTFNKKLYDDIWSILNLNVSDIFRVVNIRSIVDQTLSRLNENTTLGVVTGEHEITVHRKLYNKLDMVKDIVIPYAESVMDPSRIYDNLTITKRVMENSALFWSNSSLSTPIEVVGQMGKYDIQNCSYITLNNTQIVENHVKVLNVSQSSIYVETEVPTDFNYGNPLICEGKLHGLASMSDKEKNLFAFDTFYHKSDVNDNSSGFRNSKNINIVFSYVILVFILFTIY